MYKMHVHTPDTPEECAELVARFYSRSIREALRRRLRRERGFTLTTVISRQHCCGRWSGVPQQPQDLATFQRMLYDLPGPVTARVLELFGIRLWADYGGADNRSTLDPRASAFRDETLMVYRVYVT